MPGLRWAEVLREQDTSGRSLRIFLKRRLMWLQASMQGGCSSAGDGRRVSGSQINVKSPSQHRKHLRDNVKGRHWDAGLSTHRDQATCPCVWMCSDGGETGTDEASQVDRISGDLLFLI